MRTLLVFLLAACFSSVVSADAKSDKKAFMQAYKAYQAADQSGDRTGALKYAKEAFELGKLVYGEQSKNTAALELNYGRLLSGEDSKKVLASALQKYEQLYGKNALELIDPLMDLGARNAGFGHLRGAIQYYKRALKIVEEQDDPNGWLAGSVNLEIGRVAISESSSTQALRYLLRAEEILSNLDTNDAKIDLAKAKFWQGKYWAGMLKFKKATPYLLESLETFNHFSPQSQLTLANHASLIRMYEKQGLRDEATKHCQAIGAVKPVAPNQDYLPVYRVAPGYPRRANQQGIEGYAILTLTVDSEGFVKNPRVVHTEGSDLFGEAALRAIQRFRYVPRYSDGVPVDTTDVRYKFSFALAD